MKKTLILIAGIIAMNLCNSQTLLKKVTKIDELEEKITYYRYICAYDDEDSINILITGNKIFSYIYFQDKEVWWEDLRIRTYNNYEDYNKYNVVSKNIHINIDGIMYKNVKAYIFNKNEEYGLYIENKNNKIFNNSLFLKAKNKIIIEVGTHYFKFIKK